MKLMERNPGTLSQNKKVSMLVARILQDIFIIT
jgi:hypothetical protein